MSPSFALTTQDALLRDFELFIVEHAPVTDFGEALELIDEGGLRGRRAASSKLLEPVA